MVTAKCPSCQSQINVGAHPEMGQRVICSTCSAELDVVWLYPVALDLSEYSLQWLSQNTYEENTAITKTL
ncbi:MAG: hypothetical protein AB1345_05715 [Chloroflexota bacterium]